MAWVIIGILATMVQTIRNGFQKTLKTHLPADIVTWMRFIFGIPFALLYVGILIFYGHSVPNLHGYFWLYSSLASIFQVIGNIFLVSLFARRNFVVGITYSKTEAMISALLSACLFSEYITPIALVALIIGFLGIAMISLAEVHIVSLTFIRRLFHRSAFYGLACGLCYAASGVFIRQASIGLESTSIWISAGCTLTAMMIIQTFLLGVWVLYRYAKIWQYIQQHMKACVGIGLTSTLASIGWFTAFTIAKAPYVQAIGQLEVIFSLFLTHRFFKEKIVTFELIGAGLVVAGIILLIFSSSSL